jgi:hypothetical protein
MIASASSSGVLTGSSVGKMTSSIGSSPVTGTSTVGTSTHAASSAIMFACACSATCSGVTVAGASAAGAASDGATHSSPSFGVHILTASSPKTFNQSASKAIISFTI